MSHFFTILILPKDTKPEDIETTIEKLMAQYDENITVPEYERDCYCVGHAAKVRAREAAKAEIGEFVSPVPVVSGHGPFDFSKEESRLNDDAFAVWEALYDDAVARYLAADPDALKPDPQCEECHGTGKDKTTYNPLSKWDWYVVGGRWDGAIQKNRQRSADGGFNFGDEHHQLDRNTRPVRELLGEEAPFAIVTPDGSWHQRGRMGWWASVSDSQSHAEWESAIRGIFTQYADHLVVGLDCHI